jgi:hypothetical protein
MGPDTKINFLVKFITLFNVKAKLNLDEARTFEIS